MATLFYGIHLPSALMKQLLGLLGLYLAFSLLVGLPLLRFLLSYRLMRGIGGVCERVGYQNVWNTTNYREWVVGSPRNQQTTTVYGFGR